MKLVTYRADIESAARLGVLSEGLFVDVQRLGDSHGMSLPHSMLDLIDGGKPTLDALRQCLQKAKGAFLLALR